METENTLAFYHTRPFYDVHIVVIPKKTYYFPNRYKTG
ncbi:hypothetical protein [Cohnella kolymensis]